MKIRFLGERIKLKGQTLCTIESYYCQSWKILFKNFLPPSNSRYKQVIKIRNSTIKLICTEKRGGLVRKDVLLIRLQQLMLYICNGLKSFLNTYIPIYTLSQNTTTAYHIKIIYRYVRINNFRKSLLTYHVIKEFEWKCYMTVLLFSFKR